MFNLNNFFKIMKLIQLLTLICTTCNVGLLIFYIIIKFKRIKEERDFYKESMNFWKKQHDELMKLL